MKRIFLIAILLTTYCVAKAQMWGIPNLTTYDDRKFHFGFTLGVNTLDMGFSHYHTLDENPKFDPAMVASLDEKYLHEIDSVGRMVRADIATLIPGLTVAMVTNLRLTENLDLRFLPGLSFGNRSMVFNVPIHDFTNPSNDDTYALRSTYIDFPFLIKYKSKRIINQRPYVIGGVAMRVDLSKSATERMLGIKRVGAFAEVGMGWDTYMQFFRLSTELKYSFGLHNALSAPPEPPQLQYYNLAFKRLRAHVFTLSVHFE